MKAIEQLFFVSLFIVQFKVVLTLKLELGIVTFLEWYYFKFTVCSKNVPTVRSYGRCLYLQSIKDGSDFRPCGINPRELLPYMAYMWTFRCTGYGFWLLFHEWDI